MFHGDLSWEEFFDPTGTRGSRMDRPFGEGAEEELSAGVRPPLRCVTRGHRWTNSGPPHVNSDEFKRTMTA